MSNNNVLTTVTKQMVAECKAEAELAYMNRVGGFAEDFQGQPDRHGNLPRRMFRGAQVEFTAKGVNALLDLVFEKVAQGYKRCATEATSYGIEHFVYLKKPDAEIQLELPEVLKEAEAELRARVDKANEAIIADTIAKRKAAVLREREEAAKAADVALEAELEVEVRAALKGAK
ncbi:hypothetical protein AEQ67_09860 [Pseudomonas sp. RIT-PI-q]|uniref:hypothetical protein n=1 Tax=Pseudomonas sp. RIT-PI-q TaxID=1690247 RepID=UPI0006CD9313|nr:hypothetical protein [Pseudomonas sp. RIT-PI-q]KPG99433.1 hypothetical protein AEQ67_09860 [Pseudomonas sp. RIT-PI-q]